ncbi:hypothetical protein L6164_013251 [Bauhinia variegata]|uniref:Uncharacterized protein n=1 Tax=Bauhinia variegata TaxID=167791 RepID=A0ACB9PDX3_BAUVA|nr:hypothetical protein L6164_013251 [Bauhinia variegata]
MITGKDKLVKFVSLAIPTYLWVWTSWSNIPTMASDRLKPGDFLDSSGKLLSENERYNMYFRSFEYGEGFTYLVIEDSNFLVWTATTKQPIPNDSSAVLTLDHSGELKIIRQGGKPIIVYSPPQAINSTVAILLDDGNFVLQELHPNGSTKTFLWQSFDYPSDTLLPKMKLGVNHKTGHIWSLTAWLTKIYLSLGSSSFKLEWDPKVGELIIRKREQVYWKSGVFNKNINRFENIPEEAQNQYEYIIVSNEDEESFSLQTRHGDKDLMFNGDMRVANANLIARASNCYEYNTDRGCQIWNLSSCRHKDQVFVELPGYFLIFHLPTKIQILVLA